MKKVPAGLVLLLFISSMAFAQVKSPEQFLGYKLGARYTPHFNIVNYCKQVAEAAPQMVKLEQYGTTNEGRPLLLLYVTAPANLARYTPHFNIVNYCKQVAEAAPQMVKLEQYGTSNEGRPLLLLYVTAPSNLSRLEEIRQNNLRLAGMTNDKMAPDEKGPAILWLRYYVNG